MRFTVQWPNGERESCYSPSLIVRDYLEVGRSYPLAEFLTRTRTMLGIASERVKEKYGYYCSAAMDQLATIESRGESFDPAGTVEVVAFDVPPGF
jgi:uncharacterized repeat protein (TIGR04042 family)